LYAKSPKEGKVYLADGAKKVENCSSSNAERKWIDSKRENEWKKHGKTNPSWE
jgi:hypothetical protein